MIWLAFPFLIGLSEGAKILALFPLPYYSHTHTFLPVYRQLASRGHHVTFVSPYPQLPSPLNWTNVVIEKAPMEKYLDQAVKELYEANRYMFFIHLWKISKDLMEMAYKDEGLRGLAGSERLDFDLIITEGLMSHESLVGLGTKHGIPLVSVFPHSLSAWASLITGNDLLPSYIPDYRTVYSDRMTFVQRLDNTLLTIFELATGLFYYLPYQEMLMKKYIYHDSDKAPRLLDVLQNIPIHLVDSHHSVGYVRSHQPNAIPVGGLSTTSSAVLSKDLQDVLDHETQGFIYLSFGSHVPVSSISDNLRNSLLTAFKNVGLKVLMKWEAEQLENKPSNVELRKWFPQSAVLAHPNCKLFITHGGLHGISEAAHHGVPLLGIPFFSDQMFNIIFAVKNGFGIAAVQEEITPESLLLKMKTILEDKSYMENAWRRSRIVRDRPISAMNLAIYWIEYALRHEDLSHLRPASALLPLYQLFLLDVFIVIILVILIPFITIWFVTRKIQFYLKNCFLKRDDKKGKKDK